MKRVQIAVGGALYRGPLAETLLRSGDWEVDSVDRPDPDQDAVLVVDCDSFNQLPTPLRRPERIVLITRKHDPEQLSRAWDAGVRSVVFDDDPPSMMALAIMAAGLRMSSEQAGHWSGNSRAPHKH